MFFFVCPVRFFGKKLRKRNHHTIQNWGFNINNPSIDHSFWTSIVMHVRSVIPTLCFCVVFLYPDKSQPLPRQVIGMAALACGMIAVGSCNGEVTSTILQTMMERSEADLKDTYSRYLGLGLALCYLGERERNCVVWYSVPVFFVLETPCHARDSLLKKTASFNPQDFVNWTHCVFMSGPVWCVLNKRSWENGEVK